MLTDFFKNKIIQSMVTVGVGDNKGSGFLYGRYLITNSHCLPRLPNPNWGGHDQITLSFTPRQQTECEPRGLATVLFIDTQSDISILTLDPWLYGGTEDCSWFNKYEGFDEVEITEKQIPSNTEFSISVYSINNKWVQGTAKALYSKDWRELCINVGDDSNQIVYGTSGSPIIDQDGIIIGIIKNEIIEGGKLSYGGVLFPDSLPIWFFKGPIASADYLLNNKAKDECLS